MNCFKHFEDKQVKTTPWPDFPYLITKLLLCKLLYEEGNGNPLQCSCLENPRDSGDWWASVYGVAQSRTRLKRLSSSSSKKNDQLGTSKLSFSHKKIHRERKKSEVAQLCPILCNPMDCSLPGSSVHGLFQARVLESVAISFSRGSSQPRDWTWVSHIAGRRFTIWATREAWGW